MRAKFKGKSLTIILTGIILVSVILFTVFKSDVVGGNNNEVTDATDYFGVGEPITWRRIHENLNASKAFEVMEYLGIHRFREWFWFWMLLKNESCFVDDNKALLDDALARAKSCDIEVMGMAYDFPYWMTRVNKTVNGNHDINVVPDRNLTEGSEYSVFVTKWEAAWTLYAETFPDVTMWQVGNEYNLDKALHPEEYPNKTFTQAEKVEITMDLLYFASKGIHSVNPNATVVLGGLGARDDLTGIMVFLETLYERINCTECHPYTSSYNPDDFFQVASWHPYWSNAPNQNWIDQNIQMHNIMIKHGDAYKPVVFSEFGYSDNSTGLNETQIAEYLKQTFNLAVKNFQPWLNTIYWFRLIDPDPKVDKLDYIEYGFGLIKSPAENYTRKLAANAYEEIISQLPTYVPIYQGNLILTGNNVTAIEGIFYINGSIIVEENATLNLQNVFLKFTQTESYQHNMTLRKSLKGNPRLLVYNSTITSNFPMPIKLFGNSTATINDSTISFLESHDSAEVRVDNSDIDVLTFGPNSVEATILNLKSELVTYWNFVTNCSVNILPGGYAPNITLTNTSVDIWDPVFYGSSNVSIINSVICHPSIFGSSHVRAVDSIFTHYMYLRDTSFFSLVNSTYSGTPLIQEQSKVQVCWYLDVHVVDLNSTDVPSANVTATYPNATAAESTLTDSNGLVRLTLMEKMMNATGEYPVGNYTVEVTYESYSNNTTVNMTENQQREILVIPEFPSFLMLPLFMIATLLAVIVYRRKKVSDLTG